MRYCSFQSEVFVVTRIFISHMQFGILHSSGIFKENWGSRFCHVFSIYTSSCRCMYVLLTIGNRIGFFFHQNMRILGNCKNKQQLTYISYTISPVSLSVGQTYCHVIKCNRIWIIKVIVTLTSGRSVYSSSCFIYKINIKNKRLNKTDTDFHGLFRTSAPFN